jgi:uncharacterized protein (DUF1697 family)
MPSYAAFLRGVSPMNAKMAELRRAFESAGFTDVRTVLSSGNVVFEARRTSEASLQRKAEEAMRTTLGHAFLTIVRSIDALREILASDPYEAVRMTPSTRRTISFLRDAPTSKLRLPIRLRGASIVAMNGKEIFSTYVPGEDGPDFMTLIEKTFGKEVTTRTWESVAKVAR